ncbi:ADP-ribosylglycohydrolase family protein [Nonomuraea turcica]|uniref:ADP-ribosylglycohydrolase family protein n=1 Tax=Nonomuraea sp. G32 TaxID=3067274 RepID=UPI00273B5693|nr:ADP-ribosylglycohydrolase family protein [Nonomuraea sp. G32]MDP4507961.1 ADP-ribosylglycohydrolase family protein [Nonomuraea sp. G32]
MISHRDRARGCLLGLAAGDALGAPAENLTPAEIRRRWGRLTEIEGGGTDDTEYAIFAASLLARHGHGLTPELVAQAYRTEIIPRVAGPMRGAGFSELGTVEALRRGLEPPLTGLVHAHGWSDGLAMRAAPYGIFCPGDPVEAARLVEQDGLVSGSGEGILGGRAVAGAVAAAMGGAPVRDVVAAALSVIPADSWTARNIVRVCDVLGRPPFTGADLRRTPPRRPGASGAAGDQPFGAGTAGGGSAESGATRAVAGPGEDELGLVEALHEAVVVKHYPWTDIAPEAVALALAAFLAGDGDVEAAVTFGVSLGRDADTIGAIAGAIAGARQGESGVPGRWAARIGPVTGKCLPAVAGRHVLDVADDLAKGR